MSMSRLGPIRFLWLVVGGWVLMRASMGMLSMLPTGEVQVAHRPSSKAHHRSTRAPYIGQLATAEPHLLPAMARRADKLPTILRRRPMADDGAALDQRRRQIMTGQLLWLAVARPSGRWTVDPGPRIEPPPAPAIALAAPSVDRIGRSRWRGSAWLFARPGRVTPADAAQLGGSQAGARVAWRVDGSGRIPVSIAARAYLPLRQRRGAEGAIGIDVEPFRDAAFRLSAERRIALGQAGRNAWSAYAAGGLYREGLPLDLIGDAYAQAGIVGARKRDLFADGAARVGRRLRLDRDRAVIVGAGAWGAAQPGVARVDIGPRMALVLPVERAAISLAAEYRTRIAGDARPGSGLALTLATDF